MNPNDQPQESTAREVATLRAQLDEAHEALRTLRGGAPPAPAEGSIPGTTAQRGGPAEAEPASGQGTGHPGRAPSMAQADREARASRLAALNLMEDAIAARDKAESVAEALRDSEARFRRAVEEGPVPMLLHDEDNRILQLSRGWTRYSGYTLEDIPTMGDWTELAYGSRQGPEKAYIDGLFEIGETQSNGLWTIRAKDGSLRIWDFQTTPLGRLNQGKRVLLSLAVDVTDWKAAEARLSSLNASLEERVASRTAQLEAANKELESFSYSVSHDLRAPLRAITGYASLLNQDHAPRLDDEGRRMLGVISSEAERMGELIDNLLSFSRLAHQDIQLAEVDLGVLAHEVFSELARAVQGREIRFDNGLRVSVRCDRPMMRQVLVNLLSNAIKYTGRRALATVEFGCRIEDGQRVFHIRDNGVGFDMKYADKLFGVFQRMHSEAEFEGTGVGLALAQRIIQRHGGRMWAQASPDEGATFFFTLPQGTAPA